MKVKICGITSVADARLAARLGADAIGLNFFPGSKRCITPELGAELVAALPPLTWAIGVFVNQPLRFIRQVVKTAGLHAVQLHGDESPAFAARLGLPTLKALHVSEAPPDAAGFAHLHALVLDAAQPGYGGGGVTFDWRHARALARRHPVLLAGGLTPTNVAAAIRAVRPAGVDVASGVESSPGKKDPRKLAAFLRAVRSTS